MLDIIVDRALHMVSAEVRSPDAELRYTSELSGRQESGKDQEKSEAHLKEADERGAL